MLYRILSVCGFCTLLITLCMAEPQNASSGASDIAGNLADRDVNVQSGTVGKSIPLGTVQGAGAISFNLNLNYSSNVFNVVNDENTEKQAPWVGLGWNIHFPFISGDLKKTKDYDDDDYYYYAPGGEKSKILAYNDLYYLEKEPFVKVEPIVNSDLIWGWKITNISGMVYYYGDYLSGNNTQDATCCLLYNTTTGAAGNQDALGSSALLSEINRIGYRWNLKKIMDIYGNELVFSYNQQVGMLTVGTNYIPYTQACYPDKITNSRDGSYVKFNISTRNSSEYGNKYPVEDGEYEFYEIKFLDNIEFYNNASIISPYKKLDFTYYDPMATFGATNVVKRQLKSIDQIDMASNAKSMALFTYYTDGEGNPGAIKTMADHLGNVTEYQYFPLVNQERTASEPGEVDDAVYTALCTEISDENDPALIQIDRTETATNQIEVVKYDPTESGDNKWTDQTIIPLSSEPEHVIPVSDTRILVINKNNSSIMDNLITNEGGTNGIYQETYQNMCPLYALEFKLYEKNESTGNWSCVYTNSINAGRYDLRVSGKGCILVYREWYNAPMSLSELTSYVQAVYDSYEEPGALSMGSDSYGVMYEGETRDNVAVIDFDRRVWEDLEVFKSYPCFACMQDMPQICMSEDMAAVWSCYYKYGNYGTHPENGTRMYEIDQLEISKRMYRLSSSDVEETYSSDEPYYDGSALPNIVSAIYPGDNGEFQVALSDIGAACSCQNSYVDAHWYKGIQGYNNNVLRAGMKVLESVCAFARIDEYWNFDCYPLYMDAHACYDDPDIEDRNTILMQSMKITDDYGIGVDEWGWFNYANDRGNDWNTTLPSGKHSVSIIGRLMIFNDKSNNPGLGLHDIFLCKSDGSVEQLDDIQLQDLNGDMCPFVTQVVFSSKNTQKVVFKDGRTEIDFENYDLPPAYLESINQYPVRRISTFANGKKIAGKRVIYDNTTRHYDDTYNNITYQKISVLHDDGIEINYEYHENGSKYDGLLKSVTAVNTYEDKELVKQTNTWEEYQNALWPAKCKCVWLTREKTVKDGLERERKNEYCLENGLINSVREMTQNLMVDRLSVTKYAFETNSQMHVLNMLSQVSEKEVYESAYSEPDDYINTLLQRGYTLWTLQNGSFWARSEVRVWDGTQDKVETRFLSYDGYGNLLHMEGAQKVDTSFTYGQDDMVLITKAGNAQPGEYCYFGAEEYEDDIWDAGSYSITEQAAHTGKYGMSFVTTGANAVMTYTVSDGYNKERTYILSGWAKHNYNGAAADVVIYVRNAAGVNVRTIDTYQIGTSRKWELFRVKWGLTSAEQSDPDIVGIRIEIIGSNTLLDDIRCLPIDAVMKNTVYDENGYPRAVLNWDNDVIYMDYDAEMNIDRTYNKDGALVQTSQKNY